MTANGMHCVRGESSGLCRWTAVLIAALGILTFGIGGAAQLGTAQIQVIPPCPTTDDAILLVLSGTWRDSCVPGAPQVMILGSQITITTSNPSQICLMVLTPWQLTVPIGRLLSSGWYSVVVVHNGQPIGVTKFEVRPGKGGEMPPLPPLVAGKTDATGHFATPLPWPGTTARGRLLGSDGRPLANRSFTLTLVPKGVALVSPGDVGGFTIAVPGYTDTTVTEFTMSSSFILTTFFLGDVQLAATDELPWSADRPLTWDDFQGDPPEGAEYGDEAAEIVMRLGYSFRTEIRFDRRTRKWRAHLREVTTTNTMNRSQSWVVPGEKTPELLNHEQKHFDLNEVYRRLLDAALQKLVCTEVTSDTKEEAEEKLKEKLNEVFDKFDGKCDEVQKQYDRETDHGRDTKKQKEWDKKIGDWLADPSKAPQP